MKEIGLEVRLFSIDKAGRLLGGISPWTLRKHIACGNVKVTRIGRRVFLDAEELERIRRDGLPSLSDLAEPRRGGRNMRRLDGCVNCGEEREIAAHGLCFTCYRRKDRAKDRTEEGPADPVWSRLSYGSLLREQKRSFRLITNILKAISDCPTIKESDKKQIQTILRTYFDKLAECFAPKNCKPVNSEQKRRRSLRSLNGLPSLGQFRKPDTDYADGPAENSETAGDSFSPQIYSGE